MIRSIHAVLLIMLVAPTFASAGQDSTSLCTKDWYSVVNKKISTGDSHGHGPDLGSSEWRSVVEFKLNIRDNPEVPPTDTDQWCEYINTHYIIPSPYMKQ